MSSPPSNIRDRLATYWSFSEPVAHAAGFLLRKIGSALRRGDIGALFRFNTLQDEAFAEWYQTVGPNFAAHEATTPVPGLVARAHGVVVDLGPGTGNQLARLTPSRLAHVYGLEPNAGFGAALAARLRAETPELEGRYTLVTAAAGAGAAPALAARGVGPGDVDCVLSMQVLCSVARPRETARELYGLLRPGGELLFWEHCGSADWMTWMAQCLYGLVWPVVCGGCRLHRNIKDILLSAGDWEEVEIEDEQDPTDLLPRVSGRLVKRRA